MTCGGLPLRLPLGVLTDLRAMRFARPYIRPFLLVQRLH